MSSAAMAAGEAAAALGARRRGCGEMGSVDTDQEKGMMVRPAGALAMLDERRVREAEGAVRLASAGRSRTPQPSEREESGRLKPVQR